MTHRALAAALLLAFGLLVATPAAHAAAPMIAIIDVDKILSESKAAKSLQKQIQTKKESFQKEFSQKESELKKNETELLAQREKLTAEEFGKNRKAFEEKILETRKLFQKRHSSLEGGQKAAMAELLNNIAQLTSEVADEKKYDIVLTRDSVVVFDKTLDITAEVLKKLDAKISEVQLKVE